MNPKLLDKFEEYLKEQRSQGKCDLLILERKSFVDKQFFADLRTMSTELLNFISSYRDLMFTRTELSRQNCMRATIAAHAMNHITK